jgi:hypothetical protein
MTTTLSLNHVDATTTQEQPMVTIVVVPRERFSYSQQSLESVCRWRIFPSTQGLFRSAIS